MITLATKNGRYYAVIRKQVNHVRQAKWVPLGLAGEDCRQAAEQRIQQMIEADQQITSDEANDARTFSGYLEEWLNKKREDIEESTWQGYKIYVEKHLVPYFKDKKLVELKPSDIKTYYNYALKQGRSGGGALSRASVLKHSIVINDALNEAVLDEIITSNPAKLVRVPAKFETPKERVFLTAEKANELLMAFENHPLKALVYVTLYYGLRRSEVLGLKWGAIDFNANTLTICHTVVKNTSIIRKDTTKNKSSYQTFILIDDVKEVLLQTKAQQDLNRSFFKSKYCESDYVFTWPDGTLLRPDYVTRAFQKTIEKSGFKKMRFHDLRHSTASILYDKGWDIKDIQLWLRHSSIEVTSDIYTHISQDRKKKMALNLNSTFNYGKEN